MTTNIKKWIWREDFVSLLRIPIIPLGEYEKGINYPSTSEIEYHEYKPTGEKRFICKEKHRLYCEYEYKHID